MTARLRRPVFATCSGYRSSCFCLLEVLLLTSVIHLPVAFYQNVIFDFGIGTGYSSRTRTFSASLACGPCLPRCLRVGVWASYGFDDAWACSRYYARVSSTEQGENRRESASCFAASAWIAIWLIVGHFFTGFHDCYLIPLIVSVHCLPVGSPAALSSSDIPKRRFLPSVALLIIIGSFSLFGVRDFMSMKRALVEAHNYLIHEVGANPCNVDGGFEFNGNFCYRKDFRAKDGLSWWWVDREDYLTTLGPLDGYEVVRVFPFRRLIGPDGAVNVSQTRCPALVSAENQCIVNAKNSFRITRKTRFLKKAGFPDLSGRNVYHIQRLH